MRRSDFIEMITFQSDEIADKFLVETTAYRMTQKLTEKRKEGRKGWWECDNEDLFDMAIEHIERCREDPIQLIDAINLFAMLRMNLELDGKLQET